MKYLVICSALLLTLASFAGVERTAPDASKTDVILDTLRRVEVKSGEMKRLTLTPTPYITATPTPGV